MNERLKSGKLDGTFFNYIAKLFFGPRVATHGCVKCCGLQKIGTSCDTKLTLLGKKECAHLHLSRFIRLSFIASRCICNY